jgi:hypothetical protein
MARSILGPTPRIVGAWTESATRKVSIRMPTKPPIEEADPLEPDESEFAERVRKLQPDDPGFDAWIKKMYGHNPHLKAPEPKVKAKHR